MEEIMEARAKMREDIFIVLTTYISRYNKNQYCDEHARERATVIEDSLYRNCHKLGSEHEKIYPDIDVQALVNKLEEKTARCIYAT
jgi:hypothetical protein